MYSLAVDQILFELHDREVLAFQRSPAIQGRPWIDFMFLSTGFLCRKVLLLAGFAVPLCPVDLERFAKILYNLIMYNIIT